MNTLCTQDQQIEEAIDILIEGELLNRVLNLARQGLSAAMIASMLSLPVTSVAKVLDNPEHTSIQRVAHEDSSLIDALARTIDAEAKGEGTPGKLAVASVIFNRSSGNPFKMLRVVKKPYAFSSWNLGTPARGKGESWEDSVRIAREMASGSFIPTTNANHFYNPKKCSPKWAFVDKDRTKPRPSEQIGNHRFLYIECIEEEFLC